MLCWGDDGSVRLLQMCLGACLCRCVIQQAPVASPLSCTGGGLAACGEAPAPPSLVPAAFSSAHLISVRKRFLITDGLQVCTPILVTCRTLSSLLPWRVRTCCASDPVTGTKNLLGTDPTLSSSPCFHGASAGLFLLPEPVPGLRLNAA